MVEGNLLQSSIISRFNCECSRIKPKRKMVERVFPYVDEFKTNLMLLIHNLYPIDGLPVSKLYQEYKTYFNEDIKPYKLQKGLGIFKNFKSDFHGLKGGFWPQMFSELPLRIHFYLISNFEKGEMVIKCVGGREAEEMKILALLASYRNMQSLKLADSGNWRVQNSLPVCHKCKTVCFEDEDVDIFDNSTNEDSVRNVEIIENSVSDNISKSIMTEDYENTKQSDLILIRLEQKTIKIEPDFESDNKNDVSEDGQSAVFWPPRDDITIANSSSAIFDHVALANVIQPPLEPLKNSWEDEEPEAEKFQGQNDSIDPLDISNPSGKLNDPISPPKYTVDRNRSIKAVTISTDPNTNVSTRVLVNHLGEVKVIKFIDDDPVCQVCKKSFPDGNTLNFHNLTCVGKNVKKPQYKCIVCSRIFSTKYQLRGHNLYCYKGVKTNKGKKRKRSSSKSGLDENPAPAKMDSHKDSNSVRNSLRSASSSISAITIVKEEVDFNETL